jgi:NADPH:quinone reductase-like Zn-dependent oxidoreductase
MRAIVLAESGASPALTDLPTPEAGAGEVLVRVHHSSLNGFDLAVVAGYLQAMMEHRYPVVTGKDFAGTVVAVGDGVERFAVGDAVFGLVMQPFVGAGAHGEYVAVGTDFAITAVPPELPLPVAGVLALAGTAAIDAVAALDVQPGQVVLVSGATGGVGAIAVQYLVAVGATVIATARPGDEADLVTGLGAQHVVDYTGDVDAQVRAVAPDGVHHIVHLAGDVAQLAKLLIDGGRIATTLGFGPDQPPAAVSIIANPTPATLDRLAADVVEGRIRVPVSAAYALADVPDAFKAFTAGTLGKIAVTIA